jgi:dephospho-CoA kinase
MPEQLSEKAKSRCAVFLIGLPGSGKSTGAAFLEELGFVPISAGDTIRVLCRKEGIALTRENLSNYGQRLLKEQGYEYFAGLLLDKANKFERVVFEGIRPPEVLLWLKARIAKSLIIFVEATEQERLGSYWLEGKMNLLIGKRWRLQWSKTCSKSSPL